MKNAKDPLKKLGTLFLNFILFYALLRVIITIGERTGAVWVYYLGTTVYGLLTAGLCIAFFVLNGFTFNQTEYIWDDLPDKWSDEKKSKFLEDLPANREKAKNLIYLILPIVVTLLISYIELTFFK